MAMLQTLLAERFQLKIHREVKEGNVYALVVARSGLKLQSSTADQTRFSTYRNDPPGVSYTLVCKKVSMARIAEGIGSHLGTPVLDRTGVEGEFDFKLGPFAGDDNPDSGLSIFSVMQAQLGLRLETAKRPDRDAGDRPRGKAFRQLTRGAGWREPKRGLRFSPCTSRGIV